MANRSMDAKYKRAVAQRQALGAAEGSKPAYRTNKPLLRRIAATADPEMVQVVTTSKVSTPLTFVMYNPSIYRKPKPLALLCAVACDGELVKRGDYLRK